MPQGSCDNPVMFSVQEYDEMVAVLIRYNFFRIVAYAIYSAKSTDANVHSDLQSKA